jgi:hypothetical protein
MKMIFVSSPQRLTLLILVLFIAAVDIAKQMFRT